MTKRAYYYISIQEKLNICPHEDLCNNVHSIIHNCPKWKQPKGSSTGDEQTVIHPNSGILFGNRKEWRTDTCDNMHESQNYVVQ